MLEDDFSDILRKAQRGRKIGTPELARTTGIDAGGIEAWLAGDGVPSADEARALARSLGLDPGKLADRAAGAWEPHVGLPAHVRHHPHDPHPSNGYLFFLDDGKTAALIDPAGLPATLGIVDRGYAKSAWLAGDALSMADLFFMPVLAYLERMPEGPRLLEATPHLRRALAAMRARPSFSATEPTIRFG